MATATIKVHGLNEFVRDLRRADPELRKEFQKELRSAAKMVADEAKTIARAEGLYKSGALVRGIGVSVRGTKAFVRDRANRAGFPYPAIYEFKRGRPFLQPALDRKQQAVVRQLEDAVDRVISRF